MKRVKGYFVLILKQLDDTMYGTDYHYTTWVVANNMFCRQNQAQKIKKFETFKEAERWIAQDLLNNSHERTFEIAYLTTINWDDDANNSKKLKNWIQISSEEDALIFDVQQEKNFGTKTPTMNNDTHFWDSTQFSSIYFSWL